MIISSSMKKLLTSKDCAVIENGACLKNQGFQFQICCEKRDRIDEKICIESDLMDWIAVYRVYDMKGAYEHHLTNKTDEYYIKSDDDFYPDLLKPIHQVTTRGDEKCILFIDISERTKPAGKHSIKVSLGTESVEFHLTILEKELVETNLILTNWMHYDGICNYYGVTPFSDAFYEKFAWFLKAYVRMGNNMILLPAFTPPLDTEVGGERLTAQLVQVEKQGAEYQFDFSAMKKFIAVCKAGGIRYFEHSHLFTQWGGEFCPKIIVKENGEEYNAFGWSVSAESEVYKAFLSAYLPKLEAFLREENIYDNVYLHLTDEPRMEHLERYTRLAAFVKEQCSLKTMDALSEKKLADVVDFPVVVMCSNDLPLFEQDIILYYCVGVDQEYITNRYLHMPLQRTEILGYQLYSMQAKGFLHWGYNFYNTQLSKAITNPYEDTMAGGGFPAGDSFIVYPGEGDIDPSIRYFSIKRAFEDYRLLKTLELSKGKDFVLGLLKEEGVQGVHQYPQSVTWHEAFRNKLLGLIMA